QGDIVVYLPRELPITIDAAISLGDQNHFSADPAFPIKVSFEGERGTGNLHATGSLNGGGEVLRLRTTAGNIRLELCDVSKQIQNVREQLAQLEQQLRERMLQAKKQEKDQD
ncbi:MAG: hypothetical protein ACRETH_09075, partial [Steroidobacteraceae bacterium]